MKKLIVEVTDPNSYPILNIELPLQIAPRASKDIGMDFFRVRLKLVNDTGYSLLESKAHK